MDTQAINWYKKNNCEHAHCPLECDKPQPSIGPDGELYCMRCLCLFGIETKMVPCTPDICID